MRLEVYRCDVCRTEFKIRAESKPNRIIFEYSGGEMKTLDLCEDCLADIELILGHPRILRETVEKICGEELKEEE